MAVPGADRRKFADGHRTGGADSAAHARRKISGVSTAFGSSGSERNGHAGAAGTEAVVDTPGKRKVQLLNEPAETNDGPAPEPPAIEVTGATPIVARRPDTALPVEAPSDRAFGEDGIYLCYFGPDPDRRCTVIVG